MNAVTASSGPRLRVSRGDIFQTPGDVLVLKFAQQLHGLDRRAFDIISPHEPGLFSKLPHVGQRLLVAGFPPCTARKLLFIGVVNLFEFGYSEIRAFAQLSLLAVLDEQPHARRLLMTLHGARYGLDEAEAFASMISGFRDAVSKEPKLKELEEIAFVELDNARANRLQKLAAENCPTGYLLANSQSNEVAEHSIRFALSGARANNVNKKDSIFVAMPFTQEMEDIFYFGISGAAHSCGFVCERIDQVPFTGDVLTLIKTRIEAAKYVVADLTGANANVYLEIGYAWGRQKPTILISKKGSELKFDVQGQNCIIYASIKDLQQRLTDTLSVID